METHSCEQNTLSAESSRLLGALSLEEKAALCTGKNFWFLNGIDRLDLPSIRLADGPHGLRKQKGSADHLGIATSCPSVCFPSAVGLASSWNRDLLFSIGQALGQECLQEGVSVLLGPGINTKRSPLCGRNFEYFSEDPYLSGEMGAKWVQGVQGTGVGASLKHYAANNQENNRMVLDTIVDERTLREIYLGAFEMVVRQAQPWTVMTAYNKLGGTFLSEHKELLTKILRDEWDFQGLLLTDLGAVNHRSAGLAAGLDLDMPGTAGQSELCILSSIHAGEIARHELDSACLRVVQLILKSKWASREAYTYCESDHHTLARRAAEESIVLLKNENFLLPLNLDDGVVVIGQLAEQPRYQGSGSSQINPTQLEIPLEELRACLGADSRLNYEQGYSLKDGNDQSYVDEAVALARAARTVVLFAGLPEDYESEGFDRTHMRLPPAQLSLIDRICAECDRVVVVLQNGAPVELPFADKVDAIVEAYLGGQAGASAVARVLVGEVNPSGKLAETFPVVLADTPCYESYPAPRRAQYREGIWVGYRYYDTADQAVRFSFGHGLSYSNFVYAQLEIHGQKERSIQIDNLEDWAGLHVSCSISNTSEVAGYETAQLYVGSNKRGEYRPAKELRGFEKIYLEPGESKRVTFELGSRSFAYWDSDDRSWAVESGGYTISVGTSSSDTRLSSSLTIESERCPGFLDKAPKQYQKPGDRKFSVEAFEALLGYSLPAESPSRPFHRNSTLAEISQVSVGKLLYRRILREALKTLGGKRDSKATRLLSAIISDLPLRNLPMASGGRLSMYHVDLILCLLNGQGLKFMRTVLSGPKRYRSKIDECSD